MSQPTQAAPADATRYLPLLLVLFAGSGCSALIYETVWYQLLQLSIGSTSVSLGFLLATFMGGLCIGSVGLPRLKLAGQHPLRVYAYLELGIGACASRGSTRCAFTPTWNSASPPPPCWYTCCCRW